MITEMPQRKIVWKNISKPNVMSQNDDQKMHAILSVINISVYLILVLPVNTTLD